MHECCRLKRLTRLLMPDLCGRRCPQLFVDQRQKLVVSGRVENSDAARLASFSCGR